MKPLEHSYKKTNGIQLHVVENGPKDGECVMLLHGFPEFWYGWHKHIPYLADKGFRVMAPDQRGYNLSDKPKGVRNYKIDSLVEDIAGLIKSSKKEHVILVGHDWGGIVAWHVARKYPEFIKRLVIINAPHEGAMMKLLRQKPSQLFRSAYVFFFQFKGILEKSLQRLNWKPFTAMMQTSSKEGTFTEADLNQYRSAWSQPEAMASMLNWYRANGKTFAEVQQPTRISVPTLVIWGAKDQFLDSELASKSLAYCDDGKGILLGEATHWVHLEDAERISELIAAFARSSPTHAAPLITETFRDIPLEN